MHPRLRPVQLAAIRAIYEGDRPTFERLGAAVDVSPSTLRHRAWRESWKKMDYSRQAPNADQSAAQWPADVWPEDEADAEIPPAGPEISLEELRQRFADVLPRQLAKVLALAERGILDKPRIDALISIGRVFERSVEMAEQGAAEKQKRSDDELAAMLGRIDDRIVELAQAYAEELVDAERRNPMG